MRHVSKALSIAAFALISTTADAWAVSPVAPLEPILINAEGAAAEPTQTTEQAADAQPVETSPAPTATAPAEPAPSNAAEKHASEKAPAAPAPEAPAAHAKPENSAAAPPAPAAPNAPKVELKPTAADDDYYTQRARKIIEQETSAQNAQHPLAAAHPGDAVVVCLAGCREEKVPEIVYRGPDRRNAGLKTGVEGAMVPTSANAADQHAKSDDKATDVSCEAGCYTGQMQQASVEAAPPAASPARGFTGDNDPWQPVSKPRAKRDHLSPVR